MVVIVIVFAHYAVFVISQVRASKDGLRFRWLTLQE